MGSARIYRTILGAQLRSQTAYPASFALDCLGQLIAQATELVVIVVLFSRVSSLGGFSVSEVLLMYALASLAFGLADLAVGQLNDLSGHIRKGTFDVLLLRPLGTLPQLLASDVRLRRIGRLFSGFGVLGYVVSTVDISWSPSAVLLLAITPLAGSVIIGSVWVVACSVCFWLVEGRELANTVTYGSNFFTSYPMTVFPGWLRRFLAFVVPGAFVAYYPALTLFGRPDPLGAPAWLGWIAVPVAGAAAAVAGLVWRFAIRHYRGTGS